MTSVDRLAVVKFRRLRMDTTGILYTNGVEAEKVFKIYRLHQPQDSIVGPRVNFA